MSVVIFSAAVILNFSGFGMLERLDRREREYLREAEALEMLDRQAFHFFSRTYLFQYPVSEVLSVNEEGWFDDQTGSGKVIVYIVKTLSTSQLKFILLNYHRLWPHDLLRPAFVWEKDCL